MSSATVASLVATGTSLKWYNVAIGGTPLPLTTSLTTGNYYVSQTVGTCESARTMVSVSINVAPIASAQTFCGSATVASLVATGTSLKWYNVAIGGTPLLSTTSLITGNYYVSQTVGTIESSRTLVPVTVSQSNPPTISLTFNSGATISNLSAIGSNLKWYNVAIAGTPLSSNTILTTGNYYVSQTVGTCESARTMVAISITASSAPTSTSYDSNSDLYLEKPISIYPNPVINGKLNILAGSYDIKSINLISMSGVKVLTIAKVNDPKNVVINTSNLDKGVYLIEIRDIIKTTVHKVVIN